MFLDLPRVFFISLTLDLTKSKCYIFCFINYNKYLIFFRLFDSFLESAPQLVFQLYVLIEVSDWSTFNVTWTCVSAVASMVSLGWGVAAYSQALRYYTVRDK